MANNFKSTQLTLTAANGGGTALLACSVTSIIVSSINYHVHDGTGGVAIIEFLVQKSGGTSQPIYVKKTLPSGDTTEVLDKSLILENGDILYVIVGTITTGSLTIMTQYMERTASVATSNLADLNDVSSAAATSGQVLAWDGTQWEPTTSSGTLTDTSGLVEQSSGTEPWNRYMKNLNSLAALTDSSANDPQDVLSDTPSNVNFVVENNTLSPAPPQKVTFEQIIQALMAGPIGDIASDPSNNLSLATFTGSGGVGDLNDDGEVSTADLLTFLTAFGSAWSNAGNTTFQPSVVQFSDGDVVQLNSSTWTTLSFASGDFTATAGTQNVTVDYTTNHDIEFASQASPYLLKDVPYKEIFLSTLNGFLATVITEVASERITIRATIDLFDSGGTPLGAQGYFTWKEQAFTEAGATSWVSPGTLQITSSEIATTCSVTDGLDNASFHSVVVTLQAKTAGGNATMRLQKPKVTLRQFYIPE